MQIRPLVGIPSPCRPVCDWRKRFYWCCGAVEGVGETMGVAGVPGPVLGGPARPALCHGVGDGLTGEADTELMCKWGRTPTPSSLPPHTVAEEETDAWRVKRFVKI